MPLIHLGSMSKIINIMNIELIRTNILMNNNIISLLKEFYKKSEYNDLMYIKLVLRPEDFDKKDCQQVIKMFSNYYLPTNTVCLNKKIIYNNVKNMFFEY